ncbi:hypothetical protein BDQ17DRAFT_1333754 [Cyathus striatus]|nr:hypothetical protein BDQ17DRAFT_1333754 [Cyathus striatus]
MTNQRRTDTYIGSIENHSQFALEIIDAVSKVTEAYSVGMMENLSSIVEVKVGLNPTKKCTGESVEGPFNLRRPKVYKEVVSEMFYHVNWGMSDRMIDVSFRETWGCGSS